MPANYFRNLAQMRTPAVLTTRRFVANAAAESMFQRDPQTRTRCQEGLHEAWISKSARELDVDGRRMVFFPMFSEEDRVEAAIGVAGTLQELPALIHELKKDLPKFSEIIHQTPNVVLTARPNGNVDYLSRRWYELTDTRVGMPPEETLKRAVDEYAEFARMWALGVSRGVEFTQLVHIRTITGRRAFELSARPVRQNQRGIIKWVAALTDVDDAIAATERLSRVMHRFEILARASNVLGSAPTFDAIVEGICELPTPYANERWFAELHAVPGGVAVRQGLSAHERDVVAGALDRGSDSVLMQRNDDGGIFRFIVSEIRGDAESFGFLGIAREGAAEPIEEDRILLAEIASRVAVAVKRMQAYLRDQELAQMLQRSMLPLALPYSPGIRLDVAYEPAEREMLVGGDWYDAFELPNGLIAVAIGDVAGHGFEAAVVMNQVRHTMRAAALREANPSAVMQSANRVILAQRQPMVTALFGILDPLTLSFTFASAGHLAPLLVTEKGGVRALECEGMPLGILEELDAPARAEELTPGGALVLYTDGLIEDEHDPISGERALYDAISKWAKRGFVTRAADLQAGLRVGAHQDDAAMFVLFFPHVDEFKIRLSASPYNAQRLRHAARRFVGGSPFDGDRSYDAVLAVGEAVNNAIEHPYTDGEGFVTLSLKRETQRLIVDVRDEGVWRDTRSIDRGRGLGIIQNIADSVEIQKSDTGTNVHIELAYVTTRKPTLASASS